MPFTKSAPPQQRNAEKPALTGQERLWEFFQLLFQGLLFSALIGTLFYLAYVGIPRITHASPIFPNWPVVNMWLLRVHAYTAVPPLIIGFFAFNAIGPKVSRRWHRWTGTAYCIFIWVSAVLGVMLAYASEKGLPAQLGFGTLGVLWFGFTYLAYKKARQKQFAAHRRWMWRSYALTFAVVTVRPMFIIDVPFGLDYLTWHQMISWLCWVPNLLIAELYIRNTTYTGALKPAPYVKK